MPLCANPMLCTQSTKLSYTTIKKKWVSKKLLLFLGSQPEQSTHIMSNSNRTHPLRALERPNTIIHQRQPKNVSFWATEADFPTKITHICKIVISCHVITLQFIEKSRSPTTKKNDVIAFSHTLYIISNPCNVDTMSFKVNKYYTTIKDKQTNPTLLNHVVSKSFLRDKVIVY